MIKWFLILFFLFNCFISNLSVQALNFGNGNLNSEIRNLTLNYLEWYTLSGFDGRYNTCVEKKFQTLFSEDAVHFNFLPGTRYYLSETSIDNYIEGFKEIYQSYIIYPGVSDYNVEEVIKPFPLDIYQVKVSLTNNLHIYSNEDLDTVNISLLLEIYADLTTNTFEVIKVSDNSGDFESLNFKLIDFERKPVKGIPVFFSYSSPSDKKVITRKRYSDIDGRIKISTIPGNVSLIINAPKGYSFSFREERTVAEWNNIPENERLLFIQKDRLSGFYNRSWVQAGINHGIFVNDLFFRVNGDFSQKKQFNYTSLNPGFSFNYAFKFINKESFGIAVGTGINYSSLSFDSNVEFYEKSFSLEVEAEEGAYGLPVSGSNLQERYFYESWNIPVFLTFRYKTNKKLLAAIDFTARLSYYLTQSLSYESVLLKPGVNQTYLHKPSIDINDNNHQVNSNIAYDGSHFIGNIKQEYPVSYGAMLTFNIPVIYRIISIQASFGYQLLFLGDDSGGTLDNNIARDYDYYSPTLGYGANYIGILGADLGLIIDF